MNLSAPVWFAMLVARSCGIFQISPLKNGLSDLFYSWLRLSINGRWLSPQWRNTYINKTKFTKYTFRVRIIRRNCGCMTSFLHDVPLKLAEKWTYNVIIEHHVRAPMCIRLWKQCKCTTEQKFLLPNYTLANCVCCLISLHFNVRPRNHVNITWLSVRNASKRYGSH